jgi:hypothetical protein
MVQRSRAGGGMSGRYDNGNGAGENLPRMFSDNVTEGNAPRFKVIERDGGFWIDGREIDFTTIYAWWTNNPKVIKTQSERIAAICRLLGTYRSAELDCPLRFVTGETITNKHHWDFYLYRCDCGSLFVGHWSACLCPDCAKQAALEAKDRQREEVAKRNAERAAIRRDNRLDQRCAHCNEPLIDRQRSGVGYCSSKCRQAAYRKRHHKQPWHTPHFEEVQLAA